jgi:fructose-bisphosphate aldolase, class II
VKKLREVLEDARRKGVAIGHFNFSDSVAFNAILSAARELKVPVMVGVSEGEREFFGVAQAAAVVRRIRDEFGFPIYLNADHTHSLDKAIAAARAGFDEVIFDVSSRPFEQNIAETKKAVAELKSINPDILVEGEIGYIGASSEILDKTPEGMSALTTAKEAQEFVAATGIDVLAPAVGNMHGMLQSMVKGEAQKRLNLERIAELSKAARIFMTLHGGSGTNDSDFQKSIKAGMTIIHVNTEIRLAWRRAMEAALAANPGQVAPYKILPPVAQAVKDVVASRLRLFNFM